LVRRRTKKILKTFVLLAKRVPWWVSLAVVLVTYALLHTVALSTIEEIMQSGFTRFTATTIKGIAFVGQYLLPGLMLLGAGVNFFSRGKRDPSSGWSPSDRLAGVCWRDFELLAAEAFRRQNYCVEEVDDNTEGPDLLLTRFDQNFLVQCKHWHAWNVGEQQVRELEALVLARRAAGGILVNSGRFTPEAHRYAQSRNIQLIDGDELLQIVPACPVIEPIKVATAISQST
jgi:restriction system protein